MIGNKKNSPINVEEELKKKIYGERGASLLENTKRQFIPGVKFIIYFFGIGAICFCTVMVGWAFYNNTNTVVENSKSHENKEVKNTLPPLKKEKPAAFDNNTEAQASEISQDPYEEIEVNTEIHEKSPSELLQERRFSSGFISKDEEGRAGGSSVDNHPQSKNTSFANSDSDKGDLQNKLKPLRLNSSVAGTLGNRNFLITQGTMVDCALETRINSTVSGMTSCHLTRDIYSSNGKVILLDRGSKVIGFYQSGMQQGQARIFVNWTRVETPRGVIINFDSPGTDPLGGAGVEGYVDNHFWQRFGGAIMLSLIDDIATAATAAALSDNKSGGNQINFSTTNQSRQDMAAEALRNSINIPPTLYKNQGERVSIYIARDLDFGDVYELKRR